MSKLKYCPFCGGEAAIMYGKSDDDRITCAVICQQCHVGIFRAKSHEWSGFEIRDAGEAVEVWNRRCENE